ncbi:hypothetical protein BDR26DRAFT_1007509 [Obelidium mucronatum]|nr:hypothetical protein BDR26DRAFT_1007509 [Obelidium mucronatum]
MQYRGPHTMIPADVLKTARLTLRPLEISDPATPSIFAKLFASLSHEKSKDLFQYMTLGPFDSAKALETHYQNLYNQPDCLVYIVFLNDPEEETPIGSFSFFHCSPSDRRVEIGVVWIAGEFHGRGYALDVSYLMLQHAFEHSGSTIQRVEWSAHHLNVASQKTAVKVGFRFEGILRKHRFYKGCVRDSFMYSIVDDEWAEKKEVLVKRMLEMKPNNPLYVILTIYAYLHGVLGAKDPRHVINIGVILPLSMPPDDHNPIQTMRQLAALAAYEVNKNDAILPDVLVNIVEIDSWNTNHTAYPAKALPKIHQSRQYFSAGLAATRSMEAVQQYPNMVAVYGGYFSTASMASASVFSQYQIPMCGDLAGSPSLSNKHNYPYYFRIYPGRGIGKHILLLLRSWNVGRVAVLVGPDEMDQRSAADTIAILRVNDVDVLAVINVDSAGGNLSAIVDQLKVVDARYIVTFVATAKLKSVYFHCKDLIGSKFVWMGVQPPTTSYTDISVEDKARLNGFILVTPKNEATTDPEFWTLNKTWVGLHNENPDFSFNAILNILLKCFRARKLQQYLTSSAFSNTGYHGAYASPIVLNPNTGDLLIFEILSTMLTLPSRTSMQLKYLFTPEITLKFNNDRSPPVSAVIEANSAEGTATAISYCYWNHNMLHLLRPPLHILLTFWSILSNPKPSRQDDYNQINSFQCTSTSAKIPSMIAIDLLYAYNAILLGLAALLSYLTRGVNSDYNESLFMFFFVIAAVLTSGTTVNVLETEVGTRPLVIRSVATWMFTTFVLLIFFVPKTISVYYSQLDVKQKTRLSQIISSGKRSAGSAAAAAAAAAVGVAGSIPAAKRKPSVFMQKGITFGVLVKQGGWKWPQTSRPPSDKTVGLGLRGSSSTVVLSSGNLKLEKVGLSNDSVSSSIKSRGVSVARITGSSCDAINVQNGGNHRRSVSSICPLPSINMGARPGSIISAAYIRRFSYEDEKLSGVPKRKDGSISESLYSITSKYKFDILGRFDVTINWHVYKQWGYCEVMIHSAGTKVWLSVEISDFVDCFVVANVDVQILTAGNSVIVKETHGKMALGRVLVIELETDALAVDLVAKIKAKDALPSKDKISYSDSTPGSPKPNEEFRAFAAKIRAGKEKEAKFKNIAQIVLRGNRRGSNEDLAELIPTPQTELTVKEKLVAATEAIIAANHLNDTVHNHPSGLSAAQALTRLTGQLHDHAEFIPEFLHNPLISIVAFQDSIEAQLEGLKASLEGIIHWEAVLNSLYITSAMFLSWFVGYWNLGIGWVFVWMFFVNGAYRRNMERIKGKIEIEAARVLGLRKLENDAETESLKNTINPVLTSSKPGFLDDLSLTVFTLGTVAPRIETIRTILQTADDVLQMEWDLSFVPVDEDGVSKREKDLGSVRDSRIEVVAKLGKGPMAIPIPIVVAEIEFRARLRLELTFVSKYPHISKIDYMFTDTPAIDFTLRPLKALDMMDMPGLKNSLNQIIAYSLSGYVSPHKNSIDVDGIMNGTSSDSPVGVLKIIVHEAKNLKNIELAGISDPYVAVRLGGKVVAITGTKENNLNPYWGQTLFIPIMSSNLLPKNNETPLDELEFEIFDANEAGSDKSMGLVKSVKLSRWVKILDEIIIAKQEAKKSEDLKASKNDLSNQETASLPPIPLPSVSSGEPLTTEESEALVTEWGVPIDESGSDVWHILFAPEKSSKDKKGRGELRLEMTYMPLKLSGSPSNSPASATESEQTNEDSNVGVLTVNVHAAKEIPTCKQSSLRCDVVLSNVDYPPNGPNWLMGSTHVIKKSNNPVWECPIRFYVMNSESAGCKVSIKDGSKTVGDVDLKVQEILAKLNSKDTGSDWFKLSSSSGKVRLTFSWSKLDPAYKLSDESQSTNNKARREPKAVLKLKIMRAKALMNVEGLGRKSDPYVKIKIGSISVGATLVKENTLDPIWNETFYTVAYSRQQLLAMELWDFNNLKKDKSLGNLEVALIDLMEFSNSEVTKSKDFSQYVKDGLQVEQHGTSIRVSCPVYLQKITDEEGTDQPEPESARDFAMFRENTTREAIAAGQQRGFMFFELEYFEVTDSSQHVTALLKDDYEFIERQKLAVANEIHRLKALEQVKILTPEEVIVRTREITRKGYLGDIDDSKEQLLHLPLPNDVISKHDSGILRFHVSDAQGFSKPINAYMEIKVDDEICFSTRIQQQVIRANWNASADVCIRSFSTQKPSILLRDSKDGVKRSSDDPIVATWEGSLLDLVGKKKHRVEMVAKEAADIAVVISLGYVPIRISLADTTRNSGMLYIDIQSAIDLEAVDSGGTSDPYCLVYLNDDLIHKTQVHKKNLNPKFNESLSCPVFSRLKSTLNFVLKDHNTIGKHKTLGTVEFDLADLKLSVLSNISLPLSGARSGHLSLSVFFDHTVPAVKNGDSKSDTIDATSARLHESEDNAALKLTKGLGKETIGAFKDLGKQIKGAPKQSQETAVSAVEIAFKRGVDITDTYEHHVSTSGQIGVSTKPLISSGTVLLTIEKAEDLKAVDDNGEADPYIKVHQLLHGKDRILYKTKVLKKTRNPVWNESFQIKVPPSTVTLVLKDKNTFGASKPLGEIELNFSILFQATSAFEQWFPVNLGGQGRVFVKGQFQSDGESRDRAPSAQSTSSEASVELDLRKRSESQQSTNRLVGLFQKKGQSAIALNK